MERRTIDAIVEKSSRVLFSTGTNLRGYVLARALGHSSGSTSTEPSARVLALGDAPLSSEVVLQEGQCIPVPKALGSDEAMLALPVAMALYCWDQLNLELGEVAVYTEGDHFTDLVGQVAIWRGGCPVIRLGGDLERPALPSGERQLLSDPDEALCQLRRRIRDKPGFTAIDLSGRPETIDLLLELVPRWGRVMLAGRTRKPLTVDFYNNIHRKGALLVSSIFDPAVVFQNTGCVTYLRAAFQILQNEEMAAICLRLAPAKQQL